MALMESTGSERLDDVIEEASRRVRTLGNPARFLLQDLDAIDRATSPIEKLMLACLFAHPSIYRDRLFCLTSQERLGPFVIDILLEHTLQFPRIAIELDGHDFHERTPDQAQRDKARDRQLLRDYDTPVIRFTGSEVYRDPFRCADEAIETLRSYSALMLIGKVAAS